MSAGSSGRGRKGRTASGFVDNVDNGMDKYNVNVVSSLGSRPIFNGSSQPMSVSIKQNLLFVVLQSWNQ